MSHRDVSLPPAIEQQLEAGAALAISISGGKDSQAMLIALVALHRSRGWKGDLLAIHADLGRIEWRQTPGHVQRMADDAGIPLVVVRRADGRDLVDHWVARGERMAAQGKQARPWSDASNRFCTSDMKRDPIDAYLRRYSRVVCAVGIRAEESSARAKKQAWEKRRIDNTIRTALTWHPLLRWSVSDVLQACGTSVAHLQTRRAQYAAGLTDVALDGWPLHPAYVFGNERLSCQLCVLACNGDLQNGADHSPQLLDELIAIEDRFGFTFKKDRSLRSFKRRVAQAA